MLLSPLTNLTLKGKQAQQDLVWIQQALEGDAGAYGHLLKHYHKSVNHVAYRIVHNPEDAQDVTMVTFARAFRFLPRFEPSATFSTWLFRIAANCAIDLVRCRKHLPDSRSADWLTGQGDRLVAVPDYSPDPLEALIRQQRCELVHRAVAKLPLKYARILRLRYLEELSYAEIATQLRLPLGTIKTQLFRGRQLVLDQVQIR
jgi:RNA polymerase sigma-70 factor (ECF subfamily)